MEQFSVTVGGDPVLTDEDGGFEIDGSTLSRAIIQSQSQQPVTMGASRQPRQQFLLIERRQAIPILRWWELVEDLCCRKWLIRSKLFLSPMLML